MSYAKLRNDLLAARDARQALLSANLGLLRGSLVQISLNLPGPNKQPPGSEALRRAIINALCAALPSVQLIDHGLDSLGPWALLRSEIDATEIKPVAVELEESLPWGRLADIDVYDRHGQTIDRGRCGLTPRPCLICAEPAVDCIRLKRHPLELLEAKVNELLAPFRA